ncbi:hypothetical protein ACEPPN_000804 [Leptodophora sp. 'Broadleaf-Isolate-01']
METCQTKLGVDHPDTLSSMAHLASTLWNQGRWIDAEKLQVQVMEKSKTKLGVDHPDTLSSMDNLAATYGNQGRNLGVRQLIALAMRDYPAMPADRVKENHVQTAPTKEADPAVLRSLADLAFALGFDTPQIRALKEYPSLRTARLNSSPSPPLHVTSRDGVAMPARSGIPSTEAYEEDRDSLFVTHLHSEQQHLGEGITSFFVRKSVYLAFFGRLMSTNSRNDGSVRGSSPYVPERPASGNSSGSPGGIEEDINNILSTYAQRGEDNPAQTSTDTIKDTDDTLDKSGEREWASARARERARERDREREEREREEREREERETEKRERRERERLAQAEAKRRQVQARLERERLVQEKLEEERRRHEEQRLEEEQRRLEEQRLEEERRRLEEQRLEEERRRQEEQRQEEERRRLEEQRLEEERRRLEEQRLEEERRRQEEQRLEEERRRLEEQRLE